MGFRRGLLALPILVLLALGVCATTFGQPQSKPITLVVPTAPGGSVDGIARLFATNYESQNGQRMIVENRPGAANYTGSAYVAKVPSDGQILLFTGWAAMHANLFVKDLAVDIAQTLTPVGIASEGPQFLMGTAAISPRTLAEFIAIAKKNPGKLNAGVIPNTTDHLNTLRFLKAAQIDLVSIPYSSGAVTGLKALATGEVHLFLSTRNAILTPQIQAGKVVPLAVVSSKRREVLPSVPSTKETGVDLGDISAIYGVFGPLGLSQEFIGLMAKRVHAAMNMPGTPEKIAAQGMEAPRTVDTPAELASRFARNVQEMKQAAAEFGISPQ